MEIQILIIKSQYKPSKVLIRYLGRHYRVVEKNNVADAIYWLTCGNKAHAIVADVILPEMTGLDFLSRMNKMNYKIPPVIMLANLENESEKLKCFQSGAWDYIVKPFKPGDLVKRINYIIKKDFTRK